MAQIGQAAPRNKEVEITHHWSLKVADLFNCPVLGDGKGLLESPVFHTQHGDVGFDWRLGVYTYSDDTFHFLPILIDVFNGQAVAANWGIVFSGGTDYSREGTFSKGSGDNWEAIQRSAIESHAVGGEVTVYFHVKIAETEFTYKGKVIGKGKVAEGVEARALNFSHSNLFDKIVVGRKIPNQDPKKPDADIHQKKLDFQIHTRDGHIIWCHSLILVSGNEKFVTMIGSGLKESEQSCLEVKFGPDTMMEVLHMIYRGVALGKFQDLDLAEILDAANDYDLPKLKLACEERLLKMCEDLDGETGAQVLVLGDQYGMAGVRRKALEWASDNPAKIAKSDAGKRMGQDLFIEVLEASEAKHQQNKKE